MSDSPCVPRTRWAAKETAKIAAEEAREQEFARRYAAAERESLDDPDRPRVLRSAEMPEKITIRIPYLPVVVIAEISPGTGTTDDRTSMELMGENPETAMAGAEVALAALGYTLDRFRLYSDMNLMVGYFYLKEGPYDA